MIEQREASSERLAESILELVQNPAARSTMQEALGKWHDPQAAEHMAERVLNACGIRSEVPSV
jgi:UDP-N-acetylglucosamine:LPS N-acetylglucosamine transferase